MSRHGIVEAEAIAWPLITGWNDARTELCHREFIDGFVARSRALDPHVDARSIAAHMWADGTPILRYLRDSLTSKLRPGGREAELVEDRSDPGAEILAWRWLSLALPATLLGALATPLTQDPMWGVRVLARAAHPAPPVAHLHQHVGAAYEFEAIWTSLGLDFSSIGPRRKTPTGLEPGAWTARLLAAQLARRWLASRWMGRHLPRRSRGAAGEAVRWMTTTPTTPVSALRRRDWQSALWMPRCSRESLDEDLAMDPAGPEDRLVVAGLHRHMSGALGKGDEVAFVQYLRVKIALFRLLVMDAAERGLGNFVHVYKAIRGYRCRLERHALTFGTRAHELKPQAVELRTAPESSIGRLLDLCSSVDPDPARRADGTTRVGWILHFIRDLDAGKTERRRASHTEPSLVSRYRRHLTQALTLERAIRRWPRLLARFVGLDVAGEERAGPVWMDLPLLMRLREVSIEVCRQHPLLNVRPLRMAPHAGEDFANPLTGLRHLDELLRWGVLRRGDRVGHALTLGIDLEHFRHAVPQPEPERLLDLAWLLCAHRRQEIDLGTAGYASKLEEMLDIAGQLLGTRCAENVLSLYHSLGRPETIHGLHVESGRSVSMNEDRRRLWRLLEAWDSRRTTMVALGDDAGLSKILQARLVRAFARMHITIELNPSSNLVVGGFDRLMDLPLFRLRPAHTEHEMPAVSISSDDSLSFATRLDDEYAYAWAALIDASIPATSAQRWIDEVASAGWRAQFTAERDDSCAPRVVCARHWR